MADQAESKLPPSPAALRERFARFQKIADLLAGPSDFDESGLIGERVQQLRAEVGERAVEGARRLLSDLLAANRRMLFGDGAGDEAYEAHVIQEARLEPVGLAKQLAAQMGLFDWLVAVVTELEPVPGASVLQW